MRSDPGRQGRELYDLADLYDIAYDWDVTRELQFVLACIELHGPREPTRILEPACGTGRNLACLGRMGLEALGYDVNARALALARRRLKEEGLLGSCRARRGDMRDFLAPERFHGAFTAINSFRYLITDADVAGHLRATAAMLEPGGVYVIDLSYAMPPRLRPRVIRWSGRRGDLRVRVCWRTKEDAAAGLSHETCTLEVTDKGASGRGAQVIETRHTTRLWRASEFRAMVQSCGFRLAAIHDAAFRHLPDRPEPHGGMDNLYHILVKEP